jgi:hypothetical protein
VTNARHAAALEQRQVTMAELRDDIRTTLRHLVALDRQLAAIAEDRDQVVLGFQTPDSRAAASKATALDRAAARGLHARREQPGLAFLNADSTTPASGRVAAPVAIAATSAAAGIRYGLLHHLRRLTRTATIVALELEQTALEDDNACPWPRPEIAGAPLPADATTRELAQRVYDHVRAYANRPGLQAIRDDLDRLEEQARDVTDGPSRSNHPDACPWCGRQSLVVHHREQGQPVQIIRCEGSHACRCDYSFCGCHRNPREHRHEWVNSGRAANTWHQLHNLVTARKEAAAMEYRATEALEQIRQLHRPVIIDAHDGAELPARFPLTGDAVPEHHTCNDQCTLVSLDGPEDDPDVVHEVDLCGTCGQVPLHTGAEPHRDELWPCPTYRAASLDGELEDPA